MCLRNLGIFIVEHKRVYSIVSTRGSYLSDSQMCSAEVPVFDGVVSGVRVVVVTAELSDPTVLVAGIRPSCKHHACNGINVHYNGKVQKIVIKLNTISAYYPSFP